MAAVYHLQFQCLLGVQCQHFTIVASDQINSMSVIVMKDGFGFCGFTACMWHLCRGPEISRECTDEDKLYNISDNLVMGLNGDSADRIQFSQLLTKNIDLYKMKNKYELGTSAVMYLTRKNIIDAWKNGSPYVLNALIAGFDEGIGPQLFYMDFLGTCIQVPFASHGFGGLLSLSTLSNYYRPDLTEAEAYGLIKLCVFEINRRLFLNLPKFCVKTVSKDGIRTLPTISINPTT